MNYPATSGRELRPHPPAADKKQQGGNIMHNLIKQYIEGINIAEVQFYKNLAVFPLVSDYELNLDYLTLDEALDEDAIDVVELDSEGSVPELKVVNKSDTMVLILDGEELVGAKQNRIVNTTILIAGRDTVVIPVSCVEQGRWSYDSPKFISQKRVMTPRLRAEKSKQVKFSLKRSGNFTSDQGAIWNDISAKALRMDAASPSSAMSEIYKKKDDSIKDYTGHFSLTDSQIGAVFVINGQVVGMDCFGKPETFGKVFEKLVESYALDAIDTPGKQKSPNPETDQATKFVHSPTTCKVEPHPSVGLGTDCRLESKTITGFALAHDDRIFHLSAFSRTGIDSEEKSFTRMIRSSHRRRFRS